MGIEGLGSCWVLVVYLDGLYLCWWMIGYWDSGSGVCGVDLLGVVEFFCEKYVCGFEDFVCFV